MLRRIPRPTDTSLTVRMMCVSSIAEFMPAPGEPDEALVLMKDIGKNDWLVEPTTSTMFSKGGIIAVNAQEMVPWMSFSPHSVGMASPVVSVARSLAEIIFDMEDDIRVGDMWDFECNPEVINQITDEEDEKNLLDGELLTRYIRDKIAGN